MLVFIEKIVTKEKILLTDEYTLDQIYAMISDGTFSDIYVGDEIKTTIDGKEYIWLVADIDNYLYTGWPNLTKHHATIIPATPLAKSGINSTNTTEGGYIGSELVTGTITDASKVTTSLPKLLSDVIEPAFSGHVIEYGNLLPKEVDMDVVSSAFSKFTGASGNFGFVSRKLDLMSEMNVYGAPVWSSSAFETGIDNRHYAIFQLRPEMINSYGTTLFEYWLRNVSDSTSFVRIYNWSHSDIQGSSVPCGIRPRFLIG